MSNPVPLRAATEPSRTQSDEEASELLRSLIDGGFGRGGRYTFAVAAALLGCKERYLRAIADGEQHARVGTGLRIAKLIGPAAVNALLATIGYGGARPLDDDDEDAKPFETLAAINATSATLATALADGRLDHRERPVCVQALRELSARLDDQAADLERGA